MAEPQLIDYIKKAREIGQSDDQTKGLLYKNGWTVEEVAEALAEISPPVTQPQIQPKTQQPQPQIQPQTTQKIQQPNPITQPAQPKPVMQDNLAATKPDTQPIIQAKPQLQPQSTPPATQPQLQQTVSQPASFPMQKKRSHAFMKFVIVLIILTVLGGGGYFAVTQTNLLSQFFPSTVANKSAKTATATITMSNFSEPAFAQYIPENTSFKASLAEYQISLSELSNLSNFEKVQGNLSANQTAALTNENFFIAKNNDKFYTPSADGTATRNDDWTGLYQTIGGPSDVNSRQPQNSVFVSTDLLTHTYGKLVDEEFSSIEETNFYPTLDNLSKSLLTQAVAAYNSATDPLQKASYDRLSTYFLVTSSILDNAQKDSQQLQSQSYATDSKSDTKTAVLATESALAKASNVSANASAIASREIGLIFDAKAMVASPLMGKLQPGTLEDYTQYLPRGHYTSNVILRDYFRAMMYYGRMNFLLSSTELTRDAANIAQLLNPDQLKQWESIYQPTAFFVGQSDDLTMYEMNQAELQTGFKPANESDAAINQLQATLALYKNPQVLSSVTATAGVASTKGFRFMGQRFTPDAFIFSTLTNQQPDPTTAQTLPSTPTALMVSAVLGSKEATAQLATWVQENAKNSDKVIANTITPLQSTFANATTAQWTQNIYWSWLYAIKSLFTDALTKTGYPMFMKSEDWDKKGLQAFLGSWTELKHDSLLYSKQSYAVATAIAQPANPPASTTNPVPKGYVEPNIAFLDRLIALVNLTNTGLKQFGILPTNLETRNTTFLNALTFYRSIAVSELQNQVISDDNFEKLRLSAGQLDNILQSPDSGSMAEKTARSAIIADVHTDTVKNKILYEADGIPNYIYVAVKDANGTRLTKGLVYSYYEFTGPTTARYTDQTWQGWEYSPIPQKLQMPAWSQGLLK